MHRLLPNRKGRQRKARVGEGPDGDAAVIWEPVGRTPPAWPRRRQPTPLTRRGKGEGDVEVARAHRPSRHGTRGRPCQFGASPSEFVADSLLEGTGFEPSVPR